MTRPRFVADDEEAKVVPQPPEPQPAIALPKFEAKLWLPEHQPFYQLSQEQVNRLLFSAKMGGDVAWVIPIPDSNLDDKELFAKLEDMNQEIVDLVGLGLANDVTKHFTDKIDEIFKRSGRHVRYYSASKEALIMFYKHEERVSN